MRRILICFLAVGLILSLSVGVTAATSASGVTSQTTVERNGSARVTLTATVHLDQAGDDLYFPVPAEATNVTLNGDRVSAKKSGSVRLIDLDRELKTVAGDVSISVTYGLPDVIHSSQSGGLEMRLPMLSGFAYPISDLTFTVSLPGQIDTLPTFSSGYHQANIEKDLVYTINGATISGGSLTELKDHETLTMTLVVPEEMFPQTLADTQDYSVAVIAMLVCAGLGLLYWFVFLRSWPFRRDRSVEPPDGYTAGELGCVLNMQGVDLPLSVLTWARLGYILIQVDRHDRVRLHKRMDMGNERKEAEQRLFKKLFGKRNTVDTGSYSFAMLNLTAAKKPAGVRELMHRHSGNPGVFRGLISGMGLFGGISIAVAISSGAFLQGLLIILLGSLGALSGWYIQKWGGCLLTGKRHRLIATLSVAAVWLLLGVAAGIFNVAAGMVAGLLAGGLLLAWAGRRTDIGKQSRAQILGLRHYLRKTDKLLLQRLLNGDPDYFFSLAPYAMALGVDKIFAKRFGGKRLNGCPYLVTGREENMTALEWSLLMTRVVDSMNDRARKLPLEKLLGFIRSLTK